jgi:Carboxypeptidase regulatory-like domain
MKRIFGLMIGGLVVILALMYWRSDRYAKTSTAAPYVGHVTSTPGNMSSASSGQASGAISAPPTPPTSEAERQIERAVWDQLLATPISLKGKVIDTNGNAIANATVRYSVARTWNGQDTPHEVTSDENGVFTINKAYGLGMTVTVSKQGYYQVAESTKQLGYAKGAGAQRPPAAGSSAVFILRKAGNPAKLVEFQEFIKLPKDGRPVLVDAGSGVIGVDGPGSIQIESWTADSTRDDKRRFDWRLRFSLLNDGGFAARNDEFEFEAPEGKYEPVIDIATPRDTSDNWTAHYAGNYFVKLASGKYARVELSFVAGGPNRLMLTSHYNPDGSRNLESNPQAPVAQLNHP